MDKKTIKILVADDDDDIKEIVSYNLLKEGYSVYTSSSGKETIKITKTINPHLILLDIMMPKGDGFEVCEELRESSQFSKTLIVFFTARNEDYSQITALNIGADDYITKPIKPKLLVSKVKSLLRRLNITEEEEVNIQKYGDIEIHTNERLVYKNGIEIILPNKEFKLLSFLAKKPNKVFLRDEIILSVWGSETIIGPRTLDVHIMKLRSKIGKKYIKTIKGVGFKFSLNEE